MCTTAETKKASLLSFQHLLFLEGSFPNAQSLENAPSQLNKLHSCISFKYLTQALISNNLHFPASFPTARTPTSPFPSPIPSRFPKATAVTRPNGVELVGQ